MSYPQLVLPMRSTHVGYVHGQRNASKQLHPGVDLNYGKGNEDEGRLCIAPIAWENVHVDRQPYYGRTLVAVNHDLDLAFRFMHLKQIIEPAGAFVEAEEYFGRCGKDDGGNGRYHVGMTAHLHHDIMRLSELKAYGFNYMVWNKAVTNRQIFDDIFVNPAELYPALRKLLETPTPAEPQYKAGKVVEYLR